MTDPTPITNTEPLSPWERLPKEGPEAWQAFTIYRDLGPLRSTRRVAQTLGKSETLTGRWSGQHAWVARVEAWDDEMDRERRAAHIEAVRSMAERHVKIAHAFMEKVTERMKTLNPADLTPAQLAQFAKESVRIERQALGERTSDERTDEQDDAAFVSLMASASAYFAEREQAAFMEGAAAGAAVAADETVPEPT